MARIRGDVSVLGETEQVDWLSDTSDGTGLVE